MKDALEKTYELYEDKLKKLFDEVSDTKKMLNHLAKDLGRPIPFEDVISETVGQGKKVKPDQFYNKPLATAVRDYLEMWKEAREWQEIIQALREGGFELPRTKQAEDEARMTILRNTGNFSLIGDKHFGLKAWYPSDNRQKSKRGKDKSTTNNLATTHIEGEQDR